MSLHLSQDLLNAITFVLSNDQRVVFAYLYGSISSEGIGNDIDIAVYLKGQADPHHISADLKYTLYKATDLAADIFDIRSLNQVIEQGDIFGLLYLKNVLKTNQLLVDKDPDLRADFLERYGLRYRECEGLIREALA